MKLSILKTDGSDSGKKATLSDDIFAIEPNDVVIYEDVRSYLANQRQGTAKTKGRSEIRGGGRKAYRQKGTGMARRGTIRSPLLRGGGTVFGPQPRKYSVRINKKAKSLARKSALTYKAKDKAIVVVEDFTWESPKTANMKSLISSLKLDGKKVLLLTASTDMNVYLSSRNVPKVNVLEANKPSTYEILNSDVVLIQNTAIEVLENTLNRKKAEANA